MPRQAGFPGAASFPGFIELSNSLVKRFQPVDRSLIEGHEFRVPGQDRVFTQRHLQISRRNVRAVQQFEVVAGLEVAGFVPAHVMSSSVVASSRLSLVPVPKIIGLGPLDLLDFAIGQCCLQWLSETLFILAN